MTGTKIKVGKGQIWTLTIDRPEVRNCVDGETATAIAETILSFESDEAANVLVITGEGDTFCSGADLKDAESLVAHPYSKSAGPMGFARLDPKKPTIAAVNGGCFAGGLELAAWCDFRIADEKSEFGALNRRWGVPFIDGGTKRFAEIAGTAFALYLIETGIRFGARRALELGFVQEVVPDGGSLSRALELAEAICSYPQMGLRRDRTSVLEGISMSIDEAIVNEQTKGWDVLSDPEMAEGLTRFASGSRPPTPRS